jgi:formylglycine-generating enzyme required for sulfatase activity
MKKYAVLIGNGKFPNEPNLSTLKGPEKDLDGLFGVLTNVETGIFLPENVTPLLDKTSGEIIAAIEKVFNKAAANDLILIHYSGHGKQFGTPVKLFLMAHNTVLTEPTSTAVSVAELREIMDIRTIHKKVILILDCCYSGDAGKVFTHRGDKDSELNQALAEQGKGIYLLTSAGSQIAQETEEGGLFTKHLIEGIKTGDADPYEHGNIDINELFNYISPRVKKEYPNQQPRIYSIAKTDGRLIIAKNPRDSRKDRAEKIRQLLLDFEKQHEVIAKIRAEAIAIARTETAKLSSVQLQKDQLLTDLLNQKIPLLNFALAWNETASPWSSLLGKIASPKIWATLIIVPVVTVATLTHDWQTKANSETQEVEPTIPASEKLATSSATSVFKDEIITVKGVDFDMVAIKGSPSFQMGSPDTEPERSGDEKQHPVTVADFQMGKYEVTQAQWKAVMGNDKNDSNNKGDDLPVEMVTWNDIQTFVSRLNQETEKTGHKFNLPTEAQWEYAARANVQTNTPFYPYNGKGDCITTTYANFNSEYDYNGCGANTKNSEKKTVKVDSYQPNAFGLYNMAGNVWEWTCSAYVKDYDGSETKCISKNDAKTQRVIRGGSWINRPTYSRSAFRSSNTPDSRNFNLGFRLSRM